MCALCSLYYIVSFSFIKYRPLIFMCPVGLFTNYCTQIMVRKIFICMQTSVRRFCMQITYSLYACTHVRMYADYPSPHNRTLENILPRNIKATFDWSCPMRGRSCIRLRETSAVSVIYAFGEICTFTQLIYASAIPQSILRITHYAIPQNIYTHRPHTSRQVNLSRVVNIAI